MVTANAMDLPTPDMPPAGSEEFVLNAEPFENFVNHQNIAPRVPSSYAPTAEMTPPQPMETLQDTAASGGPPLTAAEPHGGWPTSILALNILDKDNSLIYRIDSTKLFYIPHVLYDIQIRLFDGAPVSIRVPNIPIRMLLDDIIPETRNNRLTRTIRRVVMDNRVRCVRDSEIAVPHLGRVISAWVDEARRRGLTLKLTFLDSSKRPIPPDYPVTWPPEE